MTKLELFDRCLQEVVGHRPALELRSLMVVSWVKVKRCTDTRSSDSDLEFLVFMRQEPIEGSTEKKKITCCV